ncbi:MAG TPA: transposase [Anaerohalosphaeraceae bacterium]|nr:transposase [Anaerohalosphaeraceae bacterium]HRV21258.1 transposase [Anaerohalosphaeraceae bacterium]
MTQKRRRFTAEFKARAVRAALREDKTLAQLATEFDVHPNQITEWKRQALEKAAGEELAEKAKKEAVEAGKKEGKKVV